MESGPLWLRSTALIGMENSALTILYTTTVLATADPLIVTDSLLSPQKNYLRTHLRDELTSIPSRFNISIPRIKFDRFLYIAVNITFALIIHYVLLTNVKKHATSVWRID